MKENIITSIKKDAQEQIKKIKCENKEKIKSIKAELAQKLASKSVKYQKRLEKQNRRKEEALIPKRYSVGEEIFNSVSHGVGTGLSIAGLVLLIVRAVLYSPVEQKGFFVNNNAFSSLSLNFSFSLLISFSLYPICANLYSYVCFIFLSSIIFLIPTIAKTTMLINIKINIATFFKFNLLTLFIYSPYIFYYIKFNFF